MELTKELSTEHLPTVKLLHHTFSGDGSHQSNFKLSKSDILTNESSKDRQRDHVASYATFEKKQSSNIANPIFASKSAQLLKNAPFELPLNSSGISIATSKHAPSNELVNGTKNKSNESNKLFMPDKLNKMQSVSQEIKHQTVNPGLKAKSFLTALDDDQTSETDEKNLVMDYYSMVKMYNYDTDEEKEEDDDEDDLGEDLLVDYPTVLDFDEAMKKKGIQGKKYKNALFLKGQHYFEKENYTDATAYFKLGVEAGDLRAAFQLGVIHYDGLGGKANLNYKLGVEYMSKVALSDEKNARFIKCAALYNLGRAYFQGFGVRQSDEQAEKYWLEAAGKDGDPYASIKAMSTLGLYYSREESRNLKKAYHWHAEAATHGNIESQGALGVMHLYGFGTKKDTASAFACFRYAAEKGNVYAMGVLISFYYERKLFTKTAELAQRVALFNDIAAVSKETDCMPMYVRKGIALACFYFGRCLHRGLGIKKNPAEAMKYYSRCFQFDPEACAQLQDLVQNGKI